MGAGFSAAEVDDSSETGLGDIPEGCVASILLHLTPTEICKLARLNRAFRGAALADFVWESKLPRNYGYLVDKFFDGVPESFRKKEIYARLCRPKSFDGGTKEVWLEKESGGICMSIAAKGLAITGIDDKRYWNYIPMEESRDICWCQTPPEELERNDIHLIILKFIHGSPILMSYGNCSVITGDGTHYSVSSIPPFNTIKSDQDMGSFMFKMFFWFPRFHTVAYLQQIWWFEVDGKVEFCFPAGTYSLFFRIQLGRPSKRFGRCFCNTDHIHGWDIKPVRFQLLTSDGQHALSQCYLDKPGNWIHYHVGDFVVENPNALTEVKFSMTQIDCTHTKGGLCVDSVLIYPSSFREKGKAP